MTQVLLGIGSNIEPHQYLPSGLTMLAEYFPDITISPVYVSEPLGFKGNHFWNLVVKFSTDLELPLLAKQLREIEHANGRPQVSKKFTSRTLDIDILLYGDWIGTIDGVSIPRVDIVQHTFVLKPMCDLIPHWVHPQVNKTFANLWSEFARHAHPIWLLPVEQQTLFSGFTSGAISKPLDIEQSAF